MRQLFHDPAAHEHFVREGYVVVPFLDAALIGRMRQIWADHDPALQTGFRTTMRSDALDQRQQVDREVRAALDETARKVLVDCRFLYGNFAVKKPGPRGEIYPHQDWAIVDERKCVSIGMWCPLDDVDETNGMLCVMRQSHVHVHAFRGGAPPSLPDYISVYPDLLPKDLVARYHVPLPLKAGQALVYDHRTVHYSAPNQRDETRVAVLLGFVPKEAQLLHYYQVAEKDIAIHEIPDDFFAHVLYHAQPDTPRIGTAPYECFVTYPETVGASELAAT